MGQLSIYILNFKRNYMLEFLKERNFVCVTNTVYERGSGKRHNYLYVLSPCVASKSFNVTL